MSKLLDLADRIEAYAKHSGDPTCRPTEAKCQGWAVELRAIAEKGSAALGAIEAEVVGLKEQIAALETKCEGNHELLVALKKIHTQNVAPLGYCRCNRPLTANWQDLLGDSVCPRCRCVPAKCGCIRV